MTTIVMCLQFNPLLIRKLHTAEFVNMMKLGEIDFRFKHCFQPGCPSCEYLPEKIDILIVDQDSVSPIEKLCRQSHPETKIANISPRLAYLNPTEMAKVEEQYDFAVSGWDLSPQSLIKVILTKIGLMTPTLRTLLRG
jgi:hypothetical protein